MCPLFHPRIISIRTGRLENLFIEQRPPTPTGELHHRVLRFNASPSTHHHSVFFLFLGNLVAQAEGVGGGEGAVTEPALECLQENR